MIKTTAVEALSQVVGKANCLTEEAERATYSYDNILQADNPPEAVVFASTHDEIQSIVRICYEHDIAVTSRGRGSGTVGGSVATQGGIVLSLEKMNKLIDIDSANRVAVVEPGITNQALQQALAKERLMWAPDPSSAAFCTVGGNIAYCSAGPRAVKYGTTRENTLGLTAVTGIAETLRSGAYTSKSVVGYDLTRLLVGSEGTLAIISKAILKCLPLPDTKQTLRLEYQSLSAATEAITAIMAQPITPCALEFIDHQSINMIKGYTNIACHPETQALLMVELDGFADQVAQDMISMRQIATNAGLIEAYIAESASEREELWAMRKALSPALRRIAPKKINEDVVVPVAKMPIFIEEVTEICTSRQIKNANFGHAGNGNIHVNLLVNPDDVEEMQRANICLDEIFKLVIKLNGSLSGEHGIGTAKQAFIDRELNPEHLRLMRSIKRCFDPKQLLNPGKIWLPENNSHI